ncbi:hypothetical protein SBC1_39650 (plasmid) [Caballeronia sp. SBC1]|uniref:DUF302 domain-containing protein n=1 Tax=unclassified Caballeronia TaxID=2646786 RepID=UPI0013E1E0C6|nr:MULTISPECIES: DUF302 domain-containing protein [unclassified Caballeronia]QIE26759.1 hypothetical protein SBC2_48290 [Caballeronia sp. SBC2]QIN63925.1 hypothetical protein SBC1_39650 [Caballeronia sp. SBC1]
MTSQTDATAAFPSSVVTLRSKYDFEATVSRLKAALAARGVTLFADIDQSAAAAEAGTTLRPTRLLLFGNPKAGTPVMEANPHAALELPLRAVVWEDSESTVWVDYQDVTTALELDYKVDANLIAPLKQMPTLLGGALA